MTSKSSSCRAVFDSLARRCADLSRRHVRAGTMAAALVGAVAVTATSPADAGVEIREVSGAGAAATLTSGFVKVGFDYLIATAKVSVVAPEDSTKPTTVLVELTEINAESKATVCSGRGAGTPSRFQVDSNLANAHLEAEVNAISAAGGAGRIVTVNVDWIPEDAAQSVGTTDSSTAPVGGMVSQEEGNVRRMTATGTVRISTANGSVPTHSFVVTTPAPGVAWNTTNRAVDMTRGSGGGGAATAVAAAATSSGSWSGYWTWYWDGTKWISKWTWVWVSNSTYSVS